MGRAGLSREPPPGTSSLSQLPAAWERTLGACCPWPPPWVGQQSWRGAWGSLQTPWGVLFSQVTSYSPTGLPLIQLWSVVGDEVSSGLLSPITHRTLGGHSQGGDAAVIQGWRPEVQLNPHRAVAAPVAGHPWALSDLVPWGFPLRLLVLERGEPARLLAGPVHEALAGLAQSFRCWWWGQG